MKDLNLIPQSYKAKKKFRKQLKRYSIFAAVGLGVVGLAVFMPLLIKNDLSNRIAELEKKIAENEKYLTTQREFDYVKKLYDLRVQEADMLSKRGVDFVSVYGGIKNSIPSGTYINSFKADDKGDGNVSIDLTCNSKSEDEVANFLNKLKKDPNIKTVEISSINKSVSGEAKPVGKDPKVTPDKSSIESSLSYSLVINYLNRK